MDGLKLLAHSLVDMASAANLRLEVFSVGQHAHTVGATLSRLCSACIMHALHTEQTVSYG